MKITLKPVVRPSELTVPHSQERIKLLSRVKTHGNIFAATGGVHLTANDIFKGIVLKQRKLEREKLVKEKTVRMCWSPIWNEPRTGSGIPKLEF